MTVSFGIVLVCIGIVLIGIGHAQLYRAQRQFAKIDQIVNREKAS